MNLPRISVRNPVAVNLVMLSVLVMGAYSWFQLVREFFPNIEPERIVISVAYPGATPEEMEKSVTQLIEREIDDVEGVERVESEVYEGFTLVTAELEDDADRERILNDLRSGIDRVTPDLPEDAEEPEITETRPQIPVIGIVLHGEVPERVLQSAALELRDDVLDLPEVTEILLTGVREREFVVEILPERVETLGVSYEEVARALSSSNVDLPGGLLEGSTSNVRVRTLGEEQVARLLEDTLVRARPDGSVIRLRDVARVRDTFSETVERGGFVDRRPGTDGRVRPLPSLDEMARARAAAIMVFKTPEQDAIKIAQAVKAYVAGLSPPAGGALEVTITTDLARFIEQRLDLVERNAAAGLVLVLITLALFLELRIAFWVAAGLVVSFAGTFLLMAVTGTTINLISLLGLIVVLGLIVDDAIVIGENIFTKMREGMPPLQAAEVGATDVAAPVVAAVLTTCVAFVPLAFIKSRMGASLAVLPVVVNCALLFSLCEAFFILPAHLRHRPTAYRARLARWWERFNEAKHHFFERVLPAQLDRKLRFVLRWRYAAAGVSVIVLAGAAGLLIGGVVPFVLFQDTEAETVTAKLEMGAGTPEAETFRTLTAAARTAAARPEVGSLFLVAGKAYDMHGPELSADPATIGQIILELTPAETRQAQGQGTSQEMLAGLRRETSSLPGVKRLSWRGRSGGPDEPDIEILIRGDDLDAMQPIVAQIRERLAAYRGIDELYDDLELGKLEARLHLRPGGRILGLTVASLGMQIRHALYGREAQDLQIGDEEVTVRVVVPEEARRDLADLDRLLIMTPAGRAVPLGEVARITTSRGYASLRRIDGKRVVTVSADVDEHTANVHDVTQDLQRDVVALDREHPEVGITFEGRQKETDNSLISLGIGFPAALLAIFAIIAVIFRSYTQPVIVMAVIPYSMVGVILGHWLMGFPLTLLSLVGAAALAGIVVNDGLVLVDVANRDRRAGMEAFEAVVHAARARLRAILLTSITTIAGLAPLMLERSFQAQFLIPMAISIAFGLAVGTILTLVLLPVFYLIFEDVRNAALWAWTGRWGGLAPVPAATDVAEPPPAT